MRERIEFRIPDLLAASLLPRHVGKQIGHGVRLVTVSPEDPVFAELGRLQRELVAQQKRLVSGFEYFREYKIDELQEASVIHAVPHVVFEPAGEECGTVYDESAMCGYVFAQTPALEIGGHRIPPITDLCGAGAVQASPLRLNGALSSLQADFSRTVASEVIVSARAVNIIRGAGLRGIEFDPVYMPRDKNSPAAAYFQMRIVGEPVEIDETTRAGENPFDESAYGRCPRGHSIGLNVLSEVSVRRDSVSDADFLRTRQLVGVRRGLLRPRPLVLLSPRAWRVIEQARLTGLAFEVAHLL